MPDIKYTLNVGPDRAPSIAAERDWLQEAGELLYRISGRPRYAAEGDHVYFIRQSFLVGRGHLAGFRHVVAQDLTSYSGRTATETGWHLVVDQIDVAKKPVPHKGFQGFRYLTAAEASTFPAAFE